MKITSFFLLLSILALSACEEVIQLELNSAEQRVIVEANLNATKKTCLVTLSKSGDFYASNDFEKISGASITLSTQPGDWTPMVDLGDGQYYLDNLQIEPGDLAAIRIQLPDGSLLESYDIETPIPVELTGLSVEKNENGAPGGPGGSGGQGAEQYALTAFWKDVPGMENYYRLKIYKNGVFQSATYIMTDDRLGDGAAITRPVIRQSFEKGDLLRCELLSVNKGYYDYFTDLANGEGRGFTAPAPYNPVGNLQGDALGYFGVWYVSEKEILVQ